ncbi:MAG: hypothetical protein ACXACC_11020 [Promethearchaeota archaeon]
MPHVRNFYYRPIKCPMCNKEISKNSDKWFCCKKCEEEWKVLNGELSPGDKVRVKGRDTSG